MALSLRRTGWSAGTRDHASARTDGLLLAIALLLGFLARANYTFRADFPLNDGGLFYLMARALQRSHYLLPAFVSYNGLRIPYAYPPLGFYAGALVADLTGGDLFTVLRLLPLAINLLTILAFYFLARTLLAERVAANVATLCFALIPESFVWLIMGGGLTRSFGLLFSILAVREFYLLYRRGSRLTLARAALFAALTALSHLEAATFLAISIVTLLLVHGRSRAAFLETIAAGLGALILTSPWWLTVVSRHGLGPYLSASQTGNQGFAHLFQFAFVDILTGEPAFPILAALGILGLLYCLLTRRFFLPLYCVLIIALDPRGAHIYLTVPLMLLAGVASARVLLPLFSTAPAARPREEQTRALLTASKQRSTGHETTTPHRDGRESSLAPADAPFSRWLRPQTFLAALLLFAFTGAIVTAQVTLGALTRADRSAMAWVGANTPADGRFLVMTDDVAGVPKGAGFGIDRSIGWGADRFSEWFPVLAKRVSVATPQGHEWLRDFRPFVYSYADVQDCSQRDAACLEDWARTKRQSFDFVYIPKARTEFNGLSCCWALDHNLRGNAAYRLIYDGPGASIFQRRDS